MAISMQQPMRPAEIELITQVNANTEGLTDVSAKFPVSGENLADGAVTTDKLGAYAVTNAKLANDAVQVSNIADNAVEESALSSALQTQLSFLKTVPELEYNVSNSLSVPANSNTAFTVTFGSAKSEIPVVFASIQSSATADLSAVVQSVTNSQASIIVFNHGSTDADNVTVDWLAISGR